MVRPITWPFFVSGFRVSGIWIHTVIVKPTVMFKFNWRVRNIFSLQIVKIWGLIGHHEGMKHYFNPKVFCRFSQGGANFSRQSWPSGSVPWGPGKFWVRPWRLVVRRSWGWSRTSSTWSWSTFLPESLLIGSWTKQWINVMLPEWKFFLSIGPLFSVWRPCFYLSYLKKLHKTSFKPVQN